jgi:hypothetical protein
MGMEWLSGEVSLGCLVALLEQMVACKVEEKLNFSSTF